MRKDELTRRQFLRFCTAFAAGSLLAACKTGRTDEARPTGVPTIITTAPPPSPTHSARIEVLTSGLNFPEGPAFDAQGILWCTELQGGNLVRWQDGKVQRYPTQGGPNGMAFDHKNRAWVTDSQQNAIRRFEPATGKWETIADNLDGHLLGAPNDLAFDPLGNLVFTCPVVWSEEAVGYVCCLKPDGTVVKIAEGLHFPNGLEFIDNGQILVVAESRRGRLSAVFFRAFGVHPTTALRDLQRLRWPPQHDFVNHRGELLFSVTRACQGGPIESVTDPDGNEIRGAERRRIVRQMPRYFHRRRG